MVHELKTDPAVFQATLLDHKTFEVRKNDRGGFFTGDELHLRETRYSSFDMAAGAPLEYTGRIIPVEVTYVLVGPAYGLADEYCIMSVKRS